MNEITPINPTNTISNLSETHQTKEEQQLQLPIDKIVRATVAEGGQDRIMLELGNRRFAAETRFPLKAGDKLNLLVTATSPRIELQIVADPLRGKLGHSLFLLNNSWDFMAMVQQLLGGPISNRLSPAAKRAMQAWRDVQNTLTKGNGGKMLQNLARMMGLDLEASLAAGKNNGAESLKSALLEANALLKDSQSPLAEEAENRTQLLELFQVMRIKHQQQNNFILPLPLPFLEQGYLLAENQTPDPEGEGKSPNLVSLHLSLEKMGNIQVDFLYDDKGLFVRFSCDSEDKTAFAAQYQEELSEALSFLPLQGLTFAVGAEPPAKAILKAMMAEGDSVFETRV